MLWEDGFVLDDGTAARLAEDSYVDLGKQSRYVELISCLFDSNCPKNGGSAVTIVKHEEELIEKV